VLATLKLTPVVLGLTVVNAELTPAGSPDTARLTLPENPPRSWTVTSLGELHPVCPAKTVSVLGEVERLKLESESVKATVTDPFVVPEVPVTVTVYVPGAAALVAEKVTVPGLVALAVEPLKAAVTPVGRPEIARLTLLLLRPTGFAMLIVLLALLPAPRLKVLADVKRLKLGVGMFNSIVALLFVLPEVPVTVRVCAPGAAEELGVKVKVLLLVVLAGLNAAVTPAGSPLALKATLPLKSPWPDTLIVELVLAPPTVRAMELVEDERLKLGAEIVNSANVEFVDDPEVPAMTIW
jgi:hypothetical protein